MALLGLLDPAPFKFDSIVLLAADVNNAVFQSVPAYPSYSGLGASLVQSARSVTVYFSNTDDTLLLASYAYETDYHNPAFAGRLGVTGPAYALGDTISQTVFSVDCSGVVNVFNLGELKSTKSVPSDTSLHTCYLYAPQILADITAVLADTNQADIPGRSIPSAFSLETAFAMNPVC